MLSKISKLIRIFTLKYELSANKMLKQFIQKKKKLASLKIKKYNILQKYRIKKKKKKSKSKIFYQIIFFF